VCVCRVCVVCVVCGVFVSVCGLFVWYVCGLVCVCVVCVWCGV